MTQYPKCPRKERSGTFLTTRSTAFRFLKVVFLKRFFFLDFKDCEFLKTENKKKQNDVTPHRRIRRYTLCIENYLHRDFVGIPKYLRLKFPQNIMVRRVIQTENSTLKSYLAHSMRCSGNCAIYKEEKCFLWTQINTFSRKML